MTSIVHNVTVDARDAYALASWWGQVLNLQLHPDDNPGDPECLIELPIGIRYLFIEVPEDKTVKNRLHLDLRPREGTRDDELVWLLSQGATQLSDHRREDDSGWVVLADPEGNEFCILRNEAEIAASRPLD